MPTRGGQRALDALAPLPRWLRAQLDRIPVRMATATAQAAQLQRPTSAHRQRRIDGDSGTVRVRAMFDNQGRQADARPVRPAAAWARPSAEPALVINERAIGTDQNKKFVLVVGADSKAAYREVHARRLQRRPARRHMPV